MEFSNDNNEREREERVFLFFFSLFLISSHPSRMGEYLTLCKLSQKYLSLKQFESKQISFSFFLNVKLKFLFELKIMFIFFLIMDNYVKRRFSPNKYNLIAFTCHTLIMTQTHNNNNHKIIKLFFPPFFLWYISV